MYAHPTPYNFDPVYALVSEEECICAHHRGDPGKVSWCVNGRSLCRLDNIFRASGCIGHMGVVTCTFLRTHMHVQSFWVLFALQGTGLQQQAFRCQDLCRDSVHFFVVERWSLLQVCVYMYTCRQYTYVFCTLHTHILVYMHLSVSVVSPPRCGPIDIYIYTHTEL